MSLLFRIVYAGHARGTHHKLALDGLAAMTGERAEDWRRVFLKHAERFMAGSKAPDDQFKDFKNHVLHVGENYWGGAPEAARQWYGKAVAALKEQRWEDGVFAAGVLSHYYTDPIMPFHTGQTDAENAIHRATEWSINRSYDDLRKLGLERFANTPVPKRDGAKWLEEMVCDGAELSHRSYERLIAHYDIHRGISDPPAGLDGVARSLVAELLVYAAGGYACILARALAESAVAPPDVSLTLDTVMATIKLPAKALAKKLANAEDRAVVVAMYDELRATGRVEKTLPEDDRMVRDLHAAEVQAPRKAAQAAARTARIRASAGTSSAVAGEPATAPIATPAAKPAAPSAPVAAAPAVSVPTIGTAPAAARVTPPAPPREPPVVQPAMASHALAALKPVIRPAPEGLVSRIASTASAGETMDWPAATDTGSAERPTMDRASTDRAVTATERTAGSDVRRPRTYLAATDDLEAAPSIGPKMAQRFADLGIKTVGDFLAADTVQTAGRLADRRIDAAMLASWQDQARLVMGIPGLRGTHAQLLTGAGFRSVEAITSADAAALCAAVLQFATSTDGKRALRDGDPPEMDKIRGWIDLAHEAAKAA